MDSGLLLNVYDLIHINLRLYLFVTIQDNRRVLQIYHLQYQLVNIYTLVIRITDHPGVQLGVLMG